MDDEATTLKSKIATLESKVSEIEKDLAVKGVYITETRAMLYAAQTMGGGMNETTGEKIKLLESTISEKGRSRHRPSLRKKGSKKSKKSKAKVN